MIIIVKGFSNVGKSSFSRRLAAALDFKPPVWPIETDALEVWQRGLTGWAEGAPDFLVGTHHIDTDRVVGLSLFQHRDRFTSPPVGGADVPRDVFDRWRDSVVPDLLKPPLFDRFFALLCGMIESTGLSTVVEGTLMGNGRTDSLLTRMLKFKYHRVPFVEIIMQRFPYDGPTMPVGVDVVRRALVNGRSFAPEDVIEAFHRGADGQLVLQLPWEKSQVPVRSFSGRA
jgi:hypothetical protein